MQVDPGSQDELIEPIGEETEKSHKNSVEIDLEELARERDSIQAQLKLQEMIFKDD